MSDTTPESPWPVRDLNTRVKQWIERLGHVWVEGQLAQINYKPSWKLSYVTLRDPQAEASVQLTCPSSLLRDMDLSDGDHVVVYGKPAFYAGRGSFSLWVTQIRRVGVGELLARINALREALAREGLFDPERKKPLPFLPRRVGLITGRGSAAERDVLAVARDRWPEVDFEVINTAVQGPSAVPEIVKALKVLDDAAGVDVIIIARGGGSVEDLLPFSEEALQRAVATCSTPVVSAIGHEPDNPILDNVADVRAATPTDAAKRVVPDVLAERELVAQLRARGRQAVVGYVNNQADYVGQLASRPVLADPYTPIHRHAEELDGWRRRLRREVVSLVESQSNDVASLRARVKALGPAATLARGYAVVQVRDPDAPKQQGADAYSVVTSIGDVAPGSQLRVRVGDGSMGAAVLNVTPAD